MAVPLNIPAEVDLRVPGFRGNAVAANIRYRDRLDLGLLASEVPSVLAAVFTTNRVAAAPVILGRRRLAGGRCQAVLVNAGIANACTGAAGLAAAERTAVLAADALGIDPELVLVSSTGVIGEFLPLEPFQRSLPGLAAGLSPEGLAAVARAILTTDTVVKTGRAVCRVAGREVTVAGMAKGSGMIMPNMATMLAFLYTDAAVAQPLLQEILGAGVAKTFNRITVDGDTSTNDTALILANGKAGNPPLTAMADHGAADFAAAVHQVLETLAVQIVADGEGANKLVHVRVQGAASEAEAEAAARTVANSPLVKTAFFGEDANWGRIMGALGRSTAVFDPEQVDIRFDDVLLVAAGRGRGGEAEAAATAVLRQPRFTVTIDLHAGPGTATVHTCDFSLDYVKINADYRS